MHSAHGRVGLIAAVAAVIGATACNRSAPVADASLARDLAAANAGGFELAPTQKRSQVVVSAIEAGPTSSPKRAAPKRVASPSPRPTTRVASRQLPAPAPAPTPVVREPAPVVAPPAEAAPAPITRPSPAPTKPGRVYKTEGEIFREMPWIRP